MKTVFLIDNPEIILITSAYHMPRAQKVFKAAAIKVIPFPVDFRHEIKKITLLINLKNYIKHAFNYL